MAIKSNAVEAAAPGRADSLKPLYLEAVSRVERLHRRLLDLIKDEFDPKDPSLGSPVEIDGRQRRRYAGFKGPARCPSLRQKKTPRIKSQGPLPCLRCRAGPG